MEEATANEESLEGSRSNTDAGGSPLPIIDEDVNPSEPSRGKSSDEWRKLLGGAREPLKITSASGTFAHRRAPITPARPPLSIRQGSKHQEGYS
jgi:hypothetical protein